MLMLLGLEFRSESPQANPQADSLLLLPFCLCGLMCRRVANRTGVVCLSLVNMGLDMNDHYRLFQNHARGGSYYIEDNVTHKQESLRTKDKPTAQRLLNARNEAAR